MLPAPVESVELPEGYTRPPYTAVLRCSLPPQIECEALKHGGVVLCSAVEGTNYGHQNITIFHTLHQYRCAVKTRPLRDNERRCDLTTYEVRRRSLWQQPTPGCRPADGAAMFTSPALRLITAAPSPVSGSIYT